MVHAASVSDVLLDTSFTPPCQRMGAMVAFRSFQEFTRWVPPIESLYLIKKMPQEEQVIDGICGLLFQEHNRCVELLH